MRRTNSPSMRMRQIIVTMLIDKTIQIFYYLTKKEQSLKSIRPEQKQSLVKHFDSIYECSALSEHEEKMIYLAWMWKNGIVYRNEEVWPEFDEKEAGVPLRDYEITIEYEMKDCVNLNLTHNFYDLPGIQKIIKW